MSRVTNFLQEGYGRIYPYTRNDDLQSVREDRIFTAVYLENEYVKVTVLPELGGHIYGVLDKSNNREVFYRNDVVKPGLVSLRGAWIPTGVEFNFPIGHTVSTVTPVDYTLVSEENFKGVEVGDIELVSRMKWSVTVGLYPHKSLVATRIRLYNRTDLMNRYYFWANSAMYAADGLEFLCDAPAAWNWRGVVNFPVDKGKNIAWYKSYEWGSDLFTFGGKNDFFGGYDHDAGYGVVNVAPIAEAQGRKFFTWGRGARAEVWARILTDNSGPYIEIQRGRLPTQADFSFIEPGEIVEWTEHWFPVRGLDGFNCATTEGAMNLRLQGGKTSKKAALSLNVNRPVNGVVVIEREGRKVFEKKIDMKPGDVFNAETAAGNTPIYEFTAKVIEGGREVITHTPRKPVKIKQEDYELWMPEGYKGQMNAFIAKRRGEKIKDDVQKQTAETVYREAVRIFKWDQRRSCMEKLREALKLDPEHVNSLVMLGMLLAWQHKYDEAEPFLKKACALDRENARAPFYLGVIYRRKGDIVSAMDAFYKVARRGVDLAHAARWQLAEIAAAEGKWESALMYLTQAEEVSSRADVPAILRAAMLRRLRNPEAALAEAKAVAARQATDCMAENEIRLALLALGRKDEAAKSDIRLGKKLRRSVHNFIVTAVQYARASMYDEALELLNAYAPGKVDDTDGEAMVYYYAGWMSEKAGLAKSAVSAALKKGAKASPERVFPSLPEAEPALLFAISQDGKDANARHFLGNLYAARYRPEDALKFWKEALKLDPKSDLLLRNIAYVLWVGQGKKREARGFYERSIAAGGDYRIICEADRLISESGAREERKQLWKNPSEKLLAGHNEFRTRYLHYLSDSGQYANAINHLGKYVFYSGEGGFETRRMYDDCHLYTALEHLRRKHYDAALKQMDNIRTYPKNLLIDSTVRETNSRICLIEGDILRAMGRKKEAKAKYEEGAKEALDWATPAYYYRGLCEKRLGRNKDAAKTAHELKGRLDRKEVFWMYLDGVEELFLRGLAALLAGKKAEADKFFKQVLKKRPYHRWANYIRKHGYEIF
jgi:tetratricopeptide (TPR) repeat protein